MRQRRAACRRAGCLACVVALLLAGRDVSAQSALSGIVVLGASAVPGAVVTASDGTSTRMTSTAADGTFRLVGLQAGPWSIQVTMSGFTPATRHIMLPRDRPLRVELTFLSVQAIVQRYVALPSGAIPPAADPAGLEARSTEDPAGRALLIVGSLHNSAASPFAQGASFGNHRPDGPSPYNGSAGVEGGTAAWDGRPLSSPGSQPARPEYTNVHVSGVLGGPLRVPRLTSRGTVFYLDVETTSDTNAATQWARVPSRRERAGDFSEGFGGPVVPIMDPDTGRPFEGNVVPRDRISPQAARLLSYYPEPNVEGRGDFNYQWPTSTAVRRNAANFRLMSPVSHGNQVGGAVAYDRTTTTAVRLLQFDDSARQGSVDLTAYWNHRLSPTLAMHTRYRLTRLSDRTEPYFSNRLDVAADAGIVGTDRDPMFWGPPRLNFSTGVPDLHSVQAHAVTSHTHSGALEIYWRHGRHSVTFGGELRRQGLDLQAQENPQGTLTFSGQWTGSDIADFLLGKPAASAIAFGNRDTSLRGTSYVAYLTDDWRVSPTVSVNAGLRWDYQSPFVEARGRLANLDIAPGFAAADTVTAVDRTGRVSGRRYPSALVYPDLTGVQPRVGVSWRPAAGSSLVVQAGYGIYRAPSPYQLIATRLAQQPPFSNASVVDATLDEPLSLDDAFSRPQSAHATFAVDPRFRFGYAHKWQLTVERDLDASLALRASYTGTAGRRLMRASLPNSYPPGGATSCPTCPVGFVFLASNGSSLKHALEAEVRRRLRNRFGASLTYTWSRAVDDGVAFDVAELTSAAIAQDWRDLDAERGRSDFDRRHVLAGRIEFTTAAGITAGSGIQRWARALWRDWTIAGDVTISSGLPLTPIVRQTVPNTRIVGTIRADATGERAGAVDGHFINPAAYAAPQPGEWGTASRNSLSGPRQVLLSASLARAFSPGARLSIDWRLDVTNVLNRPIYAGVNMVVESAQFGLLDRADPMRRIRTSVRVRF